MPWTATLNYSLFTVPNPIGVPGTSGHGDENAPAAAGNAEPQK
jgi:hypothetical protein